MSDLPQKLRQFPLHHVSEAADEIERLSALADKWNFECDEMREDNKRLAAERDAALADAKRFEWVLPILSGDEDSTADKRAWAMALQIGQGLTGRYAIDAAMKGVQP